MELRDPGLLRRQAFLGGAWIDAPGGAAFAVVNPADGTVVAEVPDLDATAARAAIEAAHRALPAWRARTAKERAAVLRAWCELIRAHQDDLAAIMTAEQGKPLAEARGEIGTGIANLEWSLEEAKRVYGDVIPPHAADKRIVVIKQAVGVVAAITPWNFPHGMIMRKCAPAIAAGCTVVIKPAEDTPLSALAIAVLAERAGLPAGVLNIVTARRPEPIGLELSTHPKVAKLSFTGSTAVGKLLMRQCASTVKKLSLELGGNAPFIVFDDADLGAAIEGVLASKFRNAGQTCVCANRVFVQAPVYDAFVERLTAAAAALKAGPGLAAGAQLGPLINADALAKVERLVADARTRGARVTTGGRRHALGGTFYEPTVLADAGPEMDVAREEIFGPVAPVFRFATEAEAVARANDTPYGLAGYFYSRDLGRVWRVAEALECGIVGVNVGVSANEAAPFGGVKESGLGREGSKYGIEEFVDVKYLCFGGLDRAAP